MSLDAVEIARTDDLALIPAAVAVMVVPSGVVVGKVGPAVVAVR